MNAPSCLIAGRNLTVSFDGVDVLKNVSAELHAGEVHAFIGENGAGKSTLAKCIAGVYKPRLGYVELAGERITFSNPREAIQHGVALIHQEPQTFKELNVTENVFAGHHIKQWGVINWKAAYRKTEDILKTLGLNLSPDAAVGGLSVAQQQMVELAAAMSQQARIWLFDETTAPLTPNEVAELFRVVRRLQEQNCAIAFVSHHLNEIFEIANQVTVLRDGERVASDPTTAFTPDRIVQLMVGRELSNESLRAPTPPATGPLLQSEHLCGVGFSDISLHVDKGEIVALVGLVGAGRTELARGLFGLTKIKSGSLAVGGKPVKIGSPQAAMAAGIALVPEDRQHDGLLVNQSIGFNASLAKIARFKPLGGLKKRTLAETTELFTAKLRLSSRSVNQPAKELSGGNQQKVVLSKWLMTQSKVLILDEPTRGIDVGAKHEVHKLIREQADSGVAILMITSDLPEALALADRLYVMRGGKVVSELLGSTASQEQIMTAAAGQAVGAAR